MPPRQPSDPLASPGLVRLRVLQSRHRPAGHVAHVGDGGDVRLPAGEGPLPGEPAKVGLGEPAHLPDPTSPAASSSPPERGMWTTGSKPGGPGRIVHMFDTSLDGPPGPRLAAALDTTSPAGLGDPDLIDTIAGWERLA